MSLYWLRAVLSFRASAAVKAPKSLPSSVRRNDPSTAEFAVLERLRPLMGTLLLGLLLDLELVFLLDDSESAAATEDEVEKLYM